MDAVFTVTDALHMIAERRLKAGAAHDPASMAACGGAESSLHLDEAPHSLGDQNESVCAATYCSEGRNSSKTLHIFDGGPDLSIDFLQLTTHKLRPATQIVDMCRSSVLAYRAVSLS